MLIITEIAEAVQADRKDRHAATAIACINTNRNYIGFELDKEYFETAQRRIREHQPTIPFNERP